MCTFLSDRHPPPPEPHRHTLPPLPLPFRFLSLLPPHTLALCAQSLLLNSDRTALRERASRALERRQEPQRSLSSLRPQSYYTLVPRHRHRHRRLLPGARLCIAKHWGVLVPVSTGAPGFRADINRMILGRYPDVGCAALVLYMHRRIHTYKGFGWGPPASWCRRTVLARVTGRQMERRRLRLAGTGQEYHEGV